MSTTTLYRIYGERRALLYVGITDDLDRRLRQHSEKGWWREVRTIDSTEFSDRAKARSAETQAIRTESPAYNRAGSANVSTRPAVPKPNHTGKKKLMSPAEAAEYLGVCRRTVRRRISDGTIPAYRVGHLIKIDAADLETALRPIPTAGSVA